MIVRSREIVGALLVVLAACSSPDTGGGSTPITIVRNPCSRADTVSLTPGASTTVDCSAGGTTVTLAGGGANYLVVPQFATNSVADQPVAYTLAKTGTPASSLTQAQYAPLQRSRTALRVKAVRPSWLPGPAQYQFDSLMMATGRHPANNALRAPAPHLSQPPGLGSTEQFSVESSSTVLQFKTVTATLDYVGTNVLLFVDNAAPVGGFTPAQLTAFGQLADQTMYPIDFDAFGAPSDIDGNGRVIVLMTPVVNALSPASKCATNGFVAGFFVPGDLDGSLGSHSNNGEIFYSIVPDPNGTVSCTHTVADVGLGVPSTFLHELQHLINFSQHSVIHHQSPASGWLDEGMSITAEELGSLYYEQKCPPPACRTSPDQIFPDSSQGFAQSFLYDSYQYALLPDSASVTLHNDGEDGFSWRGSDWLLVRWLSDQFGSGVLKQLELGPADGVADIASVTGQPFPAVFGNFGLALYADSFPGLPRTTAASADRFVSRNLRQLWNRLFVTSNGGGGVTLSMPLTLSEILTTSPNFLLNPGTMTFWRLNTAATDGPTTIRFSNTTGGAFSSALQPQIAIMRLPDGQ